MISGPSGVGKSTLVRRLREIREDLVFSVSCSTRRARPGEKASGNYRFVSAEEFEALARSGAFLEHAEYAGNRYGTPREPVERWLAEGKDVLLEIEVQGARQVKQAKPDAVTIFVEPPSWEELESRLRGRATEGSTALAARLVTAREELAAAGEFEHRVVNDDLEVAVAEVLRIMAPAGSRKDEIPR